MTLPAPDLGRFDELRVVEERLLRWEVRSTEEVAGYLAEDFVEFGSSGGVYDKRSALETVRRAPFEAAADRHIDAMVVRELAPGVVLITYHAVMRDPGSDVEARSLRSSIWQRSDGRWRLAFHQGTPIPAAG